MLLAQCIHHCSLTVSSNNYIYISAFLNKYMYCISLSGIVDAPYNFFVTFSNTTFLFFWGAPFSLDVTDYSPDILHYILCSNLSTYECKQIPSNPDCTFQSVCTMSLDVNDSLANGGRDLIVIDYGSVIEFTFFAVNGAGNGNVATATYIGMIKTG